MVLQNKIPFQWLEKADTGTVEERFLVINLCNKFQPVACVIPQGQWREADAILEATATHWNLSPVGLQDHKCSRAVLALPTF